MNTGRTGGWRGGLQSNQPRSLFIYLLSPDRQGIEYLRVTVLSSNHTPLLCLMDTLLGTEMGSIRQCGCVVSVSWCVIGCVWMRLAG